MRTILAVFIISLIAGCGSVASSVDGRLVTGKCLVYASLCCDGRKANINLDGKQLQITSRQITWQQAGCFPLPTAWNSLTLVDSLNSVTVIADGKTLGTIQ